MSLVNLIMHFNPAKNCIFCFQGVRSSQLEMTLIRVGLEKRHSISEVVFNLRMINDIICAIPTRLVAIFKDYLYYDDPTEYLRRNYAITESLWRLPKIFEYLEQKIFDSHGFIYHAPSLKGFTLFNIILKNQRKKRKAWDERITEIEKRLKKKKNRAV